MNADLVELAVEYISKYPIRSMGEGQALIEKISMAMGMAREMNKTARIFGADEPEGIHASHIPYGVRKNILKEYLTTKSQEKPSGIAPSLLGGAGLGAGTGALTGALAAHRMRGKGALVGAGIGAGLGAGAGALLRYLDKLEIRKSKKQLSGNTNSAMADRIGNYMAADRARESARDRAITMNAYHNVFSRR